MGCGASQHRQPYDNTQHQDSRRLVRLRDVDAAHTQRHSTRELQRVDVIKARRRESAAAISNLPKAPPKPEKLPYLKKRMSALMSPERDALKRDLSSLSKSDTSSLASRLAKLGLASHEMRGDGNCQFRGLAFNLFGSQDHHAIVRKACVSHIQTHADFFAVFFDGQDEFQRYVSNMSRDRHWGDELTLRAAVEAYSCIAHIISSEEQNWYLVYTPESSDDVEMMVPVGVKPPPKNKDVYLSYVSPIHYNSVVVSTSESQSHAGWARTEDPATGRTYYFHVACPRLVLSRRWRDREETWRRRNATDPREVESVTTPSPRDTRPRAGRDARDELDVAARDVVSLRAIEEPTRSRGHRRVDGVGLSVM
jgi:hypothetical protein